ncbi:family 16 glycosylhydrolase, partial [Paeniroseomonas aquatica]
MVASLGSVTTDASGNTYKVVLADDFSNGYQTSNWGYAYNGGTYWNGAFDWSSSDVNVRNNEMQVTDTRHADGSWTAGGFNSMKAGQSITYGTVEFDARVEQAQGTQAAILMWPVSDSWPRDGEIDILEVPKNQAMHSSHWEGTDGSHQYSSIFSTIDPSKTHHYAMTWLPNEVTIKVDGQVVARWTDAAAIPDTAMGFGAMGYVAAKGEEWLGDAPDGTTPSVVTTHIDNVVMSQWTGTGPVPKPEPTPAPAPLVDTTPVVKTIGSGSDALVLKITQDVYKVGAQYTVSVDGKQIGGTLTAGAAQGSGQTDVITVKGDWAAGAHKVTVTFLNDTWGGTSATDSNLHVTGMTYNGKAVAGGTADLMSNGPVDLAFTEAAALPPAPPPPPPTGTGAIPALFGTPGTWGQAAKV